MKNNTYDDRNNNYKKYTIFAYITCFIMVLFTTIGYSAMNATVNFKGDVALRVAGDIRITGVSKSSATNNALSTYANFSKTTLALGTTMPANSTITYSFKIKNSSSRAGLLTNLVTTGTNAKATQNLSLTVTPSTSNIIASSSRIPSSTENTYTITLTNNTSNTVTDQRLLTFTYDYIYKITYNLNGGSLSNSNPTEYFPGQSITLNNPTRSGYTFEGWTGSNGSTKSKSVKVDTSKNMDLSYTANYELNYLYKKLISMEASNNTYDTGVSEIKAKGNPDFSKSATTDEGMYAMKDDYGTSYYYRGAVPDNWVSFAGFLWRVIRVNGDNTVRMIYSGTTDNHTGTGTQIGKSAFNSSDNSPKYVGYMYGDSDTTENEVFKNKNDSTIKGVIDNWYKNNLSSYSSLIADEVFCNDRTLASGNTYSTSSNFDYALYNRLATNESPRLTCPNLARDGFTTTTASIGNKALTYPVGLITADEVSLAGGVVDTDNDSYYLNTGQYYWALSPYHWDSTYARVFIVSSSGFLYDSNFVGSDGVRPVVSLKTSTLVTKGTGTEADPYVVASTLSQKLISSEASDSTYATGIKEIKAKGNPDFSQTSTTDDGMYAMKDDYGTSYYYRGAVPDNWVSFAGFLWRVIRVNGDNTVRMIYSGTTDNHTGTGTQIGKSAFNSSDNSPKYVGYMYGDSDTTENEVFKNKNDSTIKGVIDNWYKNNLSSYSSLIADEVFCNDRTLASGNTYSTSSNFDYALYNRLATNESPRLTCPNLARDGFTTTTASIGNKALTYPVGLITADEVSLAGGVVDTDNDSYYLNTGQYYWALSPYHWDSTYARVFIVSSSGFLYDSNFVGSDGVRPVVSLKTSTLVTKGTGTETDPYVVE